MCDPLYDQISGCSEDSCKNYSQHKIVSVSTTESKPGAPRLGANVG